MEDLGFRRDWVFAKLLSLGFRVHTRRVVAYLVVSWMCYECVSNIPEGRGDCGTSGRVTDARL